MLDIKITRTTCPKEKPQDETKLGFGKKFTDHMFVMDYTEGEGWHDARIVPYAPFQLDPATVVFHYAQEIFEGMKAYRTADDTIQLFRPDCNAKRMQDSADRLCIPKIPVEDYIQAVEALVDVERDWVPHADGASWDPRGLFAEAPVKFLGNLPYSAGGAILQNFLSRPSAVERAVVMLQKEFIDRILATPDDDAFGLLSLRIQKNWIPRALKTIPPEAFHPRPRIDSTVMLLTPRPARELPPYDDRLMDELMRKAFSQRRKQLKKQLPASPPWEGVAASLGLSPSSRAEELNLSQWVELARVYDTNPLKDVAQSGDELFEIVDELNQVTGQGTRREIHEGSLRHRAVHMFLVNKHGAVLLQKRSLWKDRQPGKWDSSAAGHLDAGESYEEAVVRELKEELGVSGCGLQKIADFDAGENNGWEFISLYEGRYSGKVRFPAAEVDSVQWFTPEQIQAWVQPRPQDFSPAFIPCWNAWLAANRKNHSKSNTYHDKP